MKKIVILLCKTNYRKNNLNNFYRFLILKKYIIIPFAGIFFYIGLFLAKLNIFKVISIDADPKITADKGFNFWLSGTVNKIPKNLFSLKNNMVNMKSVFNDEDKIFQLYPIFKFKKEEQSELKIVYCSSYKIIRPDLSIKIIRKFEEDLKKKLIFFDKKNFWNSNIFKNNNNIEKFLIYRDLKLYQRKVIVENLIKNFKNKLILIGNDWKKIYSKSYGNIFNKTKITNLYKNNICLDLGSASGSLSLYPRSIEIIENNGYILQLKQSNSKKIYNNNEKIFTFDTLENLNQKINELLNNRELFYYNLKILNKNFINSKNLINNQLELYL